MLTVKEMQPEDMDAIAGYWLNSDYSYLASLGVDISKLPSESELKQMLTSQYHTPLEQKNSYCIIWQKNGQAIGHCNVNPVNYGNDAYMHLHIWKNAERKKGSGLALLQMTLPYFFEKLQLKKIYSEPYALNPAPNRTLEKVGFRFIKEYITIPGSLSNEQPVKQWEMTRERFDQLLPSRS